ncbi:hypothetical protein, partial [Verrucomicrobium spinosum]|uniref:hypothetical protein n=1 Tax=Verrucomicrobium spinosum TaxID=2736 RepID=UPI0012E1D038
MGNWPGDTPWEGLFIGEGRHLKSGNEEQFFDGSIYAQRTIGGNVIVLNDEAILTRVPDYLGTFSTLNSNLEFGKSFGDSWSSSGVSLVELLDQAMSPKAEITLEGDYLKCTIPAFGGVSNVDLRIQIELEPGKVFLPKTIWVARSLAGKNVPIELLNGSKIEYMDYRLVNGKIYLPYAIKGTSYTSLESSFDDPQLRDELFKHTKLRVDPGVVIPLVEHTLRINSLTLRPKADGSSIQLPVTVGTIVKDRMLNKEYIFENSILKKANGLKNDSKNK